MVMLFSAASLSEFLTPAIVSLITLAVALPIQSKTANSKALKTVEGVYSGIIERLEKRIKTLEDLYTSNHCENAPFCKNRKK